MNLLSKDLGIECKCIGRIEEDEDAKALYKTHFKPSMYEPCIGEIRAYVERLKQDKAKFDLELGDMDMFLLDLPKERYYDDSKKVFPSVLWLVERCMPRYIVIEAANTYDTYDKGAAMQFVFQSLGNLGYVMNYCVTNAESFGIPQFRRKMWILASLEKEPCTFRLTEDEILNSFDRLYPNSTRKFDSIHDILEKGVRDLGMWINDKSKEFIFAEEYNGAKLWHKINPHPAMTLKPNMCKMQRANSDNYYTWDYIESDGKKNEERYVPRENWKKIKRIRRLTHMECLRFQGFPDSMLDDAMFSYVQDTALYRMIAASTNVNQAYATLRHIIMGYNIK